MTPTILYLVKVILCSGILYGYYRMALRNKLFHQWNRFYLLISVFLSLLIPFITINISEPADAANAIIRLATVVANGEDLVIASGREVPFHITIDVMLHLIYIGVAAFLSAFFIAALYRILRIIKSYPGETVNNIHFISSDAKGSPFSFFNYIIWNWNIDMTTTTGRQIFNHELVHVQEKHSLDKLLLNLVLIPFWINPFFWFIRHELYAIHEFIADEKSVDRHDTETFVHMILNTVYPKQHHLFTNHFFHSSIKRRLYMFTKLQSTKVSYASRIVALPLFVLIVTAFTVKTTKQAIEKAVPYLDKTVTIIIDAGHGGSDAGATTDAILEKDIALSMAKKIKELNKNEKIEIVLTRETDLLLSSKDRVKITDEAKADLFISLHINSAASILQNGKATDNPATGIEVFLPGKNLAHQEQSELFGSLLLAKLSATYTTSDKLKVRANSVWILNQVSCPAIILECGYMSNKKDFAFITQKNNQAEIAEKVLASIEQYFSDATVTNSLPLAQEKGSTRNTALERISDNTKESSTVSTTKKDTGGLGVKVFIKHNKPFKGIIFINDKIFNGVFDNIPVKADDIQSINVLKGEKSIDKYGEQGKNGVIEITTKQGSTQRLDNTTHQKNTQIKDVIVEDTVPKHYYKNKEIRQLEVTAKTQQVHITYADGSKEIMSVTEAKNQKLLVTPPPPPLPPPVLDKPVQIVKGAEGELYIRSISLNEAKKYKDLIIIIDDKIFEGTIDHLPLSNNEIKSVFFAKGQPLVQEFGDGVKNGAIIITSKKLSAASEKNRKPETRPVFTQVETEPQFPGGKTAWQSFLQKNLNASTPVEHGAPEGTYKVMVQFIVDIEGNASDIKALTHHGYGMEEEVVNVIKKGPKWIPALQNGHKVTAYKKQPITFVVSEVKEDQKRDTNTTSKLNTLFVGIDNLLTIAASDVRPENLVISILNGSITRINDKIIARVTTVGDVTINVSAYKNGILQEVGKFTCKAQLLTEEIARDLGMKIVTKSLNYIS